MNRHGVLEETLQRYAGSTADNLGTWGLATAVMGAFALQIAFKPKWVLPRWVLYVSLLPVLGLAVVHAWQLRWMGDDAFISFRYAKNLAEGLGLVFNEGARVEGYTNFLWTVIMAAFIELGFDPGQVAVVLGLLSLALASGAAALLVRRLLAETQSMLVSFAAILLAANYTFASYGTSGLETMFAALLVLVAVERAEAGALLAAGTAGIAATLAHPDHAVFYAVLGVLLFVRDRFRSRAFWSAPSERPSGWRKLVKWVGSGLWSLRASWWFTCRTSRARPCTMGTHSPTRITRRAAGIGISTRGCAISASAVCTVASGRSCPWRGWV
jgi:hypothetical protein